MKKVFRETLAAMLFMPSLLLGDVTDGYFRGGDCRVNVFVEDFHVRVALTKGDGYRDLEFRIPRSKNSKARIKNWCLPFFWQIPALLRGKWYGNVEYKKADEMVLSCEGKNQRLEKAVIKTDLDGDFDIREFQMTYVNFEGSSYSHHNSLQIQSYSCENLVRID